MYSFHLLFLKPRNSKMNFEKIQSLSVLLVLSFGLVASGSPKHWALIVAGSNGYYNYRHQADVCHAYQILRKNGIPDEQIVVMMYDDIAHSPENPTPGIVINQPNGQDVYHDVPKDYVGKNVTPEVFLNVLLCNKTALKTKGSGKCIDSGPEDHVFINFADHGAPGLLAFPDGELYSKQLMQALQIMYSLKKYHKMVLYIEACESGSMFDGLLPNDMNIYATTAANEDESSYACYYDEKRGTYLGDVYSVRWMEDADNELINAETLMDQFNIVRAETNTSHVSQFGDREIGAHYEVGEFIGTERFGGSKRPNKPRPKLSPIKDAVPAPDVPLHILRKRLDAAQSTEIATKIQQQLESLQQNRRRLDRIVEDIVHHVASVAAESNGVGVSFSEVLNAKPRIRRYSCFERVVSHFSRTCAPLSKNDYALRKVRVLVNLCEMSGVDSEVIYDTVTKFCHGHQPFLDVY